jgi:hypothetical protein
LYRSYFQYDYLIMASKQTNGRHGGNQIFLADSITKLGSEFRNKVLVCGSHGGRYCGYLAAFSGLRGVILNDAGLGKNNAGIGALDYLQPLGIPAATVAHTSARIGDGVDTMERGRVSYCNAVASELGCLRGQTCHEVAEFMLQGAHFQGSLTSYEESRTVLCDGLVRVLACDSASLVKPIDAGAIVVTGSHGGILAGRPYYGISAKVRGAVFNDAGIGMEEAGIQRLKVLERAGVPAAVVDYNSACIGDALSTWESGVISHVNEQAEKFGIVPAMVVPDFVELLSA